MSFPQIEIGDYGIGFFGKEKKRLICMGPSQWPKSKVHLMMNCIEMVANENDVVIIKSPRPDFMMSKHSRL